MKTKILFTLLLALPLHLSAQSISKITLVPANPTPSDSLMFLVDVQFTSGSCDAYITNSGQVGNQLYANALHCVGALAVICDVTDTFYFPPQPAGAYTFTFQVNAGGAPAPCTPGIVAGPSDSITFLVNPTHVHPTQAFEMVQLVPNPARNSVLLNVPENLSTFTLTVQLYDLAGKHVATLASPAHNRMLQLDLPGGHYTYQVIHGTRFIQHGQLIVNP